MERADFWKKLPDGHVLCNLCARSCNIPPEEVGFCKVRKNVEGELFSMVYGYASAQAIDPIEKKPFFNFYPSSKVFSFSTVGCNFRCLHCQNYEISQDFQYLGVPLSPTQAVEKALANSCHGIAYTYNEPTIFFEYAKQTAIQAKNKGLFSVFVSNGYMSTQAARDMDLWLDAIRIDLKAMSNEFYNEICGGAKLQPVLNNIRLFHNLGMHLEVVCLLIPGYNDSDEEIAKMCSFVSNLSKEIPIHFTAYYPAYKLNAPPTPIQTLKRAENIAYQHGLNYVYLGNVPTSIKTYCKTCKRELIVRDLYSTKLNFDPNKDFIEVRSKSHIYKKVVCPYCSTINNIVLEVVR